MKSYLSIILILLSVSLYAQNASENYVKTVTMRENDLERMDNGFEGELEDMECIVSVQYYDGLGRPGLSYSNTGPGKNMVYDTRIYDFKNRETQTSILASIVGNPGFVDFLGFQNALCSFCGDTSPFTTVTYDYLDRITRKKSPGAAFQGHPQTLFYRTNSATAIRKLRADLQGNISYLGFCEAATLTGEIYQDEDGVQHTVYKDRSDHVVFERDNEWNQTYYVYDDYDRLAYVLPSEACSIINNINGNWNVDSDSMLMKYAYCYRYDNRDHCVWKKLPGCAPITMSYDKEDRLVFQQDGNQRSKNTTTFYLYDLYGRQVVMGECGSLTPDIENLSVQASFTGSGCYDGYIANIDIPNAKPLLTRYYDSYDFIDVLPDTVCPHLAFVAEDEFSEPIDNCKSLQTGAKIHNLDVTGSFTISANYYDIRGRVICTRSTNSVGGMDITFSSHSFTNQPLKTLHRHTRGNGSVITEEYNYEYDHADRLLSVVYSLNGCAPVTLSEYTYDDIGRVATKTVGGSEIISYHYNIRNWTTEIIGSKFMERLAYNQTVNDLSPGTPCYNGNIAAMQWAVQGDALRGYRFTYDGLNRLETACYGEGPYLNISTGRYDEAATYDCMGNMTAFDRYGRADNGDYGLIDGLEYTYDGNHVVKITDWDEYTPTVKDAFHFHDGANVDVEYEYDENGNMTKDLNRGFLSIEYNLLNLPQLIEYQYGRAMKFTYDATGRKLKAEETLLMQPLPFPHFLNTPLNLYDHGLSGDQPQSHPRDSLVTVLPSDSTIAHSVNHGGLINNIFVINYCGNIIYDCNQRIVQNPEGYATLAADGTPTFHYYVRDHLGSVRVVFNEQDSIEQANHYYPWGGLMAVSTGGDAQRYKFCGKELIRDHGIDWYDHGARWYDATAPTWHTMDPLCEKTPSVTPYMYCHGNPVLYVDYNGEAPTVYEAAIIAKHVYGDRVKLVGGWIPSTNFKNLDSRYGLKSAVYERTLNGVTEYVYATAGTEPTDINDWKEDFLQLFGKVSQYRISVRNAYYLDRIIGKDNELVFVGHSLGGGEATVNALATGRDAITFNPAALTDETLKSLGISRNNSNSFIWNVVVNGEVVDYEQRKIGLKPIGSVFKLSASYAPFGGALNFPLRVMNHLIDNVIERLREFDKPKR